MFIAPPICPTASAFISKYGEGHYGETSPLQTGGQSLAFYVLLFAILDQ